MKKEGNTSKLNGENFVFKFIKGVPRILSDRTGEKLTDLDSFFCCDSSDPQYSVGYETNKKLSVYGSGDMTIFLK